MEWNCLGRPYRLPKLQQLIICKSATQPAVAGDSPFALRCATRCGRAPEPPRWAGFLNSVKPSDIHHKRQCRSAITETSLRQIIPQGKLPSPVIWPAPRFNLTFQEPSMYRRGVLVLCCIGINMVVVAVLLSVLEFQAPVGIYARTLQSQKHPGDLDLSFGASVTNAHSAPVSLNEMRF